MVVWLIDWLTGFFQVLAKTAQENKTIVVEGDQSTDDRFLGKDESTLILFARCDREKEDLFWRFLSASGKTPYRMALPEFKLPASPTPLNTFFARAFADILVDPIWKKVIGDKIQAKIKTIKRPHYLEELKLVDVDMGPNLPTFGQVCGIVESSIGFCFYSSILSHFYVWSNFDLYGRFQLLVTMLISQFSDLLVILRSIAWLIDDWQDYFHWWSKY